MSTEREQHYQPKIKELPETERPRERMQVYGASVLSTPELLAIIMRTGSAGENAVSLATRIVSRFGGLSGLARASLEELAQVKGVGPAKACEIRAAIELGARLAASTDHLRPTINSPEDAAALVLTEMSLLTEEELRVMVLDTKNRLLTTQTLYRGTVNQAPVRPAELFREAVRRNGAAILMIHNHPSGDPAPSQDDARTTERIRQVGTLMEIDVLDHLVIGGGRFVSLRRAGLGFGTP